jgi:hypothetical protein
LSFSKGFHNAPKLYHDPMVQETPMVRGVKGGLRAAGTVSLPTHRGRKALLILYGYVGIHARIIPRHNWDRDAAQTWTERVWDERDAERCWQGCWGCCPQANGRYVYRIPQCPNSSCYANSVGLWGLAGYPLEGLHKTLRSSLSRSKLRDILASRIQQGLGEMVAATPEERAAVIERWHKLQAEESNGRA